MIDSPKVGQVLWWAIESTDPSDGPCRVTFRGQTRDAHGNHYLRLRVAGENKEVRAQQSWQFFDTESAASLAMAARARRITYGFASKARAWADAAERLDGSRAAVPSMPRTEAVAHAYRAGLAEAVRRIRERKDPDPWSVGRIIDAIEKEASDEG